MSICPNQFSKPSSIKKPNNPFNGMLWVSKQRNINQKKPLSILITFYKITRISPNLLPCSQLFADLAQVEKSKLIYQKGINVAKSQTIITP
ncbi:hypothetical protein QWZ00_00010 [Belliella kenyensis]|uniref:hypothetical protein n=1 Tax=Belliella kenyensis TaxID=1472724 RepID=UPI0025B3A2AA|nr:hypothetical protein [Belliella kenyensis]MDN3601505.1 hypothetical protein [Belliella kenyensis]